MKLKSLHIQGFRGIAELALDFNDRLTVVVGENGIGKTSVLDALAIMLDQYIARYVLASPQRARQIKDSDVYLGGSPGTSFARLEINVEAERDICLGWALSKSNGRLDKIVGASLSRLDELNQYVRQRAEGKGESLLGEPLLVYYGQRRAVLDMPQRLREAADLDSSAGFRSALNGQLDFREFVAWFRDRSLLELQQRQDTPGYTDHQMGAVRRAMTNSTGLRSPEYRMVAPRGLCVTKVAHRPPGYYEEAFGTEPLDILRVDQLSSGEKIFLALAGDLARRLAVLTPEGEDPLRHAGIVLIDEVELHLHPRWQRKFIPWLLETFPNCQFVVTTHSPQVLGEVEADAIRVLRASDDGSVEGWTPDATKGRDSNYILLHVLGGAERDEGLKGELEALDEAIAAGRLDDARQALTDLRGKIEGSPPELTIAQARLERRQRQQGREE